MVDYFKRVVKFSIKVALGTAIVTTILGFSGIVLILIMSIFFASLGSYTRDTEFTREIIYGNEESDYHFVSVPITGIIVGDSSDVGEPFGLLSEMLTYGYDVKANLRDLAENETIDGVILEINSPGGTIYGSKAIVDGVTYYKEKTKKPVISFISGLAASGAYWAAISGDKVIADYGTSVGSIGVISGPFQYYDTVLAQDGGLLSGGVVTQKGIETLFITAGKSKDFGNPFRKLTEEEIASMQSMVNNEYDTFVEYVTSRRSIPREVVTENIGALLYDGKTGTENKLIDATANKEEAYKELARLGNIPEDDFSVSQEYPKKGLIRSILESRGIQNPLRTSVSFCGLNNVRLAYHGDVTDLCHFPSSTSL